MDNYFAIIPETRHEEATPAILFKNYFHRNGLTVTKTDQTHGLQINEYFSNQSTYLIVFNRL